MAKNKNNTIFSKITYMSHFVLRAFLIALLCLILGFGLLVFVYIGDLVLNNTNPLFSTYVIVSPSMVPTIKIDDAIIVKRVDNDKYKVGDIITFESNDDNYKGLAITHRIVDKQNLDADTSIYTTKGDNNMIIDPVSVRTDSIYGKVMFKVPSVGKIQEFFSHPANYLLCLLIAGFIFIVYDVTRIFVFMNKKRKFA